MIIIITVLLLLLFVKLNIVSKQTCICVLFNFKKGADIIGINCHFGPDECIEACRLMKEALDAAGTKKHLMVQPLGYFTPDAGKQGFIDLPEFPFG